MWCAVEIPRHRKMKREEREKLDETMSSKGYSKSKAKT
jgi:hypothetical protein